MSEKLFENFKSKLYLIIPIICIGLWFLYNLVHHNFIPTDNDLTGFYNAGKRLLENPLDLYSYYNYMPVLATIFSVSISLLPHTTAQYVFYFINLLMGALFILEYNKVLILMNIRKKFQRFMFLIVISNGLLVYQQFYENHFEFISGTILFYIIRTEIQYRIEKKEKNLNYYIINYGLFVFVVGITVPLIFLLLIYLFQDIPLKDLFKWNNIRKYIIVISWFAFQNFVFFIYPSHIFSFLSLFFTTNIEGISWFFYLREWVIMGDYFSIVNILLVIAVAFLTLILIMNKKLEIEKKFIYSCLFYIIFYSYGGRRLYIMLAFSILIYIQYLNQDEIGIEFVKKNLIIIIGLLSVVGIYFMIPLFTINKYFSFMMEYPYIIIVNLRYIFLLSIFYISLFILYIKQKLFSKY